MFGRRSGGRRRRTVTTTPSTGGYRQFAFQPCSNCCSRCADRCIAADIPLTLTAVLGTPENPLMAGCDCDNLATLGDCDCMDMFGTFQLEYAGFATSLDPICESCHDTHVWRYYEPFCTILGYQAYHYISFCVSCNDDACHATLVSSLIWYSMTLELYQPYHTWMWWQEWPHDTIKTSWNLTQSADEEHWYACGAWDRSCRQICLNYSAVCMPPQNTFSATVS